LLTHLVKSGLIFHLLFSTHFLFFDKCLFNWCFCAIKYELSEMFSGGTNVVQRTQCLTDTFSTTSPGNRAPPTICGSNTGDHSKFRPYIKADGTFA